MSETLWLRFMASSLVVTGVVWLRRKEFGVGWEGKPPSFYIRGGPAVVAGIVLIVFGLIFFAWPQLLYSGE